MNKKNQEKFFDQEKHKQKQKTIKILQKQEQNQTKTIDNAFEILKYCKEFYSDLYTKTQNNLELQETLPEPIEKKTTQK